MGDLSLSINPPETIAMPEQLKSVPFDKVSALSHTVPQIRPWLKKSSAFVPGYMSERVI